VAYALSYAHLNVMFNSANGKVIIKAPGGKDTKDEGELARSTLGLAGLRRIDSKVQLFMAAKAPSDTNIPYYTQHSSN